MALAAFVQLSVYGNEIVVRHHVVHLLSCTRKYQVNCPDSICVLVLVITDHRESHEFNHRVYVPILIPYTLPVA